jgi:hypothetical protein
MKPTFKTQPGFFYYFRGICLILFVALLYPGCHWGSSTSETSAVPSAYSLQRYSDSQLVVWRKPGTTDQQFKQWFDSIGALGAIDPPLLCKDCDNALMLLTGPGITNYIQHATVSGGSGTGKGGDPSGGDGPIYYSVNYIVDLKDSMLTQNNSNIPQVMTPYKEKNFPDVIVAVFDTGIDPVFLDKNYFYDTTLSSCMGAAANNGWNFSGTPPDNKWQDDYLKRHGTIVSKFIVDQVNATDGNGIKLLPVKIHNKNGESSLFSVLCGFSYAANRGAQIINASFGYYALHQISALTGQATGNILLKEYIKTYLTNKNILLIAAAGNAGPSEETPAFAEITPAGKRNLDSVSFYPASLAGDEELPNVIAVTTVNDGNATNATVSPIQNYSMHVVDIGVSADNGGDYSFADPLSPSNPVIGSSFAAPIVVGRICANYHWFINPGVTPLLTKQNIINVLLQLGLVHNNASLKSEISNGIVMHK